MDSSNIPNEEKKAKRPRIGASAPAPETEDGERQRFERVNYSRRDDSTEGGERRHYQPRQGGYQPRQGGYRPAGQGGYQQRGRDGYQPRSNYGEYSAEPKAEGTEGGESTENTGYQPRQGGYQPRQGGYQQGGYQQRGQGGYQQRGQGGYQQRGQGGYQQRDRGGYQQRGQGGYQQRGQGGYQQRGQGGYQQRGQQGGYQQRGQQGGYQQHDRQGGYQQRGQGGQGGYRQGGQGGYRQGGHGGYQQRGQGGQGGFFPQRGKSFTPRPKRIEYELPIPDPNEQIRLNKFMSNAGICSRREADEFIQQGLVKVNGQVVTELGTKICHSDVVEYDDKVVALESKCYILLNKPKDCVTTCEDPNDRTTVMDLVKGACTERIYPVGRLDRNTTGVLLLTNDGDLASKLTHPKYVKKKIYHVWCDKDITEDDMQRIADGIELEDGPIYADAISYATETDRNQAGIEIHSGRNRIVRRIFESLGYHVTKLDRVYFAGLTKKNLPRGRWRYLTQEEVNLLKMGAFE